MIQLRSGHLAAFEPQMEAGLLLRVAAWIRETQAGVVSDLPDVLLREMVRNGLARAKTHGLRLESSLSVFVWLMFRVAPNFDENPSVRRVLNNRRLPPDERIHLLGRLGEETWTQALLRYDERAWFPELYEGEPEPSRASVSGPSRDVPR